MDDITRDQAFIIAVLYKYYTEHLNAGMSPKQANDFKDSHTLHDDYFCDKDKATFLDNLKVLFDKDYVDGEWDGTKINDVRVSEKGFDAVDTNLLSK